MNIIIPAAGLGSRFKDTHDEPKPLIPINGVPMIVRAIESFGIKGKYHFILRNDSNMLKTVNEINKVVSNPNIILVDKTTEGAAVSALMFESTIDTNEELMIINCDQIMHWDSDLALHEMRKYDGAVVTYKHTDPKHSFVKLEDGLAVEMKEKEVISDDALVGIHYWAHAGYFFDSANRMIKNNDRANNGEFYVAPSYNYLIRDGLTIGAYQITNKEYYAVGTPEDLEKYLNEINEVV